MNSKADLKSRRNLSALIEFSKIINSSIDFNFILNNILLSCLGKYLTTKGLIAIKSKDYFEVRAIKGVNKEVRESFPKISASDDIVNNPQLQKFSEANNFEVIEKIYSSNDCIGLIVLGKKLSGEKYSDDDLQFLKTILNISSSAIQNSLMISELKKVNRMLDSKVGRLNSLVELSKEFGFLSESSKVVKLLIYSVIGQFLISRFAVVISENNKNHILENKFPEDKLKDAFDKINIEKITTAVQTDELKIRFPELLKLGVELIIPMQIKGQTKGLLLLAKRINNLPFTEDDLQYIFSVGSLTITAIENQRLFAEEIEKQKMEEDLDIAREIQKNLLPTKIPEFENIEISALNISSKQVGGDYFDIIPLNGESFVIAIGDVSGKGVPAAILMANLQAFLKSICRQKFNIVDATALLNDLISENTSEGKFITFFWGIVNTRKKEITYVNAGHNPPLLIRENKIIKLEAGGMIFGVMKTTYPYKAETIGLKKDDVLILFTDGVTEALNEDGIEFSDERFEKLALNITRSTAREIINNIEREVKLFSNNAPQSDDITLLVLKSVN